MVFGGVLGGVGGVGVGSAHDGYPVLYCSWNLVDLFSSITRNDVTVVSLPLSQKPLQQRDSHTQPHYRLSLGDVPFVAGTVCLQHTHTHP